MKCIQWNIWKGRKQFQSKSQIQIPRLAIVQLLCIKLILYILGLNIADFTSHILLVCPASTVCVYQRLINLFGLTQLFLHKLSIFSQSECVCVWQFHQKAHNNTTQKNTQNKELKSSNIAGKYYKKKPVHPSSQCRKRNTHKKSLTFRLNFKRLVNWFFERMHDFEAFAGIERQPKSHIHAKKTAHICLHKFCAPFIVRKWFNNMKQSTWTVFECFLYAFPLQVAYPTCHIKCFLVKTDWMLDRESARLHALARSRTTPSNAQLKLSAAMRWQLPAAE